MLYVLFWTNAISYFLVGTNYFLRTACIMLVEWVGYATETVKLERTTTVTFLAQFFNTAFLLLMVNVNWSEQPISFGLTSGDLPDFNGKWYKLVGATLVYTMIFNSVYPFLEAMGYYGMRIGFRVLDWLFRPVDKETGKKKKTSATSIQSYIDTYAGPTYFMYFKYSTVQNIVFVTFMFGFGMPMLFPIAAFSFLVLYLCERSMLFYAYRLPPMYDHRLSESVLTKLKLAPLFLLFFGYWMVSNQQLISNDHLTPIDSKDTIPKTGHLFTSVFLPKGWEALEWPMIGAFVAFLVWDFFSASIKACFKCCCPEDDDLEIDEDIANYWASLDENDRKWSIREELNSRDALNLSILTDDQYERL